jgi:hypothetical protein
MSKVAGLNLMCEFFQFHYCSYFNLHFYFMIVKLISMPICCKNNNIWKTDCKKNVKYKYICLFIIQKLTWKLDNLALDYLESCVNQILSPI